MVAGDGDAAVDRGIELQVVVAGAARDDHTDPGSSGVGPSYYIDIYLKKNQL